MSTLTLPELHFEKDIHTSSHFHPSAELIHVLIGNMDITVGSGEASAVYHLRRGDILLVNFGVLHSISCEKGTYFLDISYPVRFFPDLGVSSDITFECSSTTDRSRSYEPLRELLDALIREEMHSLRSSESLRLSILLQIADLLLKDYKRSAEETDSMPDDDRLRKIAAYVGSHYSSDISLEDLSSLVFMSPSSVSRLFRRLTGENFSDYLRRYRLEAARAQLLSTEDPVTRIATDCGFSTPSSFNHAFRREFGVTPTQSRESCASSPASDQEQLRKELLEANLIGESAETQRDEAVRAVFTKGSPLVKNWNTVIAFGTAKQLQVANIQNHILTLSKELGFKYVRIWNIYSRYLMITDGMSIGGYNFAMLDEIFDFLDSNDLLPFIDFAPRQAGTVGPRGQMINSENECVSFASRAAWEAMMSSFIQHICSRYGKEKVSTWIFEFSNSSDRMRYYEGDAQYSYFNVFSAGYKIIKARIPDARIGGPMLSLLSRKDTNAVSVENDLCPAIAEYAEEYGKARCMPDFFTFMMYADTYSGDPPERNREMNRIDSVCKTLEQSGIEKPVLIISEFNNSLSCRNYLNDGCYRGAYYIHTALQLDSRVKLLCPWMGSDWSSNYYDSGRVANGGAGLLTKAAIRKPVFHAISFLNQLGSTVLGRSDNCIITRNEHGDLFILCYFFVPVMRLMGLKEEGIYSKNIIPELYRQKAQVHLEITIDHMQPGRACIIKTRTVREQEGSLLSEWGRLGFDDELEENEVRYIRNACYPRMTMDHIKVQEDGTLHLNVNLDVYQMSLLHIYPAE